MNVGDWVVAESADWRWVGILAQHRRGGFPPIVTVVTQLGRQNSGWVATEQALGRGNPYIGQRCLWAHAGVRPATQDEIASACMSGSAELEGA